MDALTSRKNGQSLDLSKLSPVSSPILSPNHSLVPPSKNHSKKLSIPRLTHSMSQEAVHRLENSASPLDSQLLPHKTPRKAPFNPSLGPIILVLSILILFCLLSSSFSHHNFVFNSKTAQKISLITKNQNPPNINPSLSFFDTLRRVNDILVQSQLDYFYSSETLFVLLKSSQSHAQTLSDKTIYQPHINTPIVVEILPNSKIHLESFVQSFTSQGLQLLFISKNNPTPHILSNSNDIDQHYLEIVFSFNDKKIYFHFPYLTYLNTMLYSRHFIPKSINEPVFRMILWHQNVKSSDLVYLPFEDFSLPIPPNPDSFLSHLFGPDFQVNKKPNFGTHAVNTLSTHKHLQPQKKYGADRLLHTICQIDLHYQKLITSVHQDYGPILNNQSYAYQFALDKSFPVYDLMESFVFEQFQHSEQFQQSDTCFIPNNIFSRCNMNRIKKWKDTFDSNVKEISDCPKCLPKRTFVQMIESLVVVFQRLDIPFNIVYGTVLGLYRQCDHLPFTTDLDIAIDHSYILRTPEIISHFIDEGFVWITAFGNSTLGLELSFRLPQSRAKVDLFFFFPFNATDNSPILSPTDVLRWQKIKYPNRFVYNPYWKSPPKYNKMHFMMLTDPQTYVWANFNGLTSPVRTTSIPYHMLSTAYGPGWNVPSSKSGSQNDRGYIIGPPRIYNHGNRLSLKSLEPRL